MIREGRISNADIVSRIPHHYAFKREPPKNGCSDGQLLQTDRNAGRASGTVVKPRDFVKFNRA